MFYLPLLGNFNQWLLNDIAQKFWKIMGFQNMINSHDVQLVNWMFNTPAKYHFHTKKDFLKITAQSWERFSGPPGIYSACGLDRFFTFHYTQCSVRERSSPPLTARVAEEHADVLGGLAVGTGRARLRGELHQEAEQDVGRRQAVAVLQHRGLTAVMARGRGGASGRPQQPADCRDRLDPQTAVMTRCRDESLTAAFPIRQHLSERDGRFTEESGVVQRALSEPDGIALTVKQRRQPSQAYK